MGSGIILSIFASVFVTSFISGIIGMAGGMILMGILAWILPVSQAMIIHATAQFFANATRAIIHRKHIYRPSLKFYFAGLGLMFALFTLISFLPGKMTVFLLLGLSPFAAFALPKNMRVDFTKPAHAFLCGAIVTVFQLTSGVGGPLLDSFFQNRKLTRHETVATKAFTQAAAHLAKFVYFSMIASTFSKTFADVSFIFLAALVPIAMAGTHAGKFVLDKITDKQFYRATQTLLLASGALYLFKAASIYFSGP